MPPHLVCQDAAARVSPLSIEATTRRTAGCRPRHQHPPPPSAAFITIVTTTAPIAAIAIAVIVVVQGVLAGDAKQRREVLTPSHGTGTGTGSDAGGWRQRIGPYR